MGSTSLSNLFQVELEPGLASQASVAGTGKTAQVVERTNRQLAYGFAENFLGYLQAIADHASIALLAAVLAASVFHGTPKQSKFRA